MEKKTKALIIFGVSTILCVVFYIFGTELPFNVPPEWRELTAFCCILLAFVFFVCAIFSLAIRNALVEQDYDD